MEGFPQHTIAPDVALWRIHRAGRSPWFFRNDGTFRFDLTGSTQHGTCYFAESPLGAFVETLQSFREVSVPRPELTERRLFRLELEHALSLADTTRNPAARFGVDASIAAGSPNDYTRSQEFANRAYEAGFAGIRYRVRNDLEQALIGIALFGPIGSHEAVPPMPTGASENIPETVVNEACQVLDFRVRGPLLEPA